MKDMMKTGCEVLGKSVDQLERWQLMRAVELALLAVLCFAAGRVLSSLIGWGNSAFSGFWVILVALLVTKDSVIKLKDLQWRFFAVCLGVLVGFVTIQVFNVNSFSLFVSVVIVAWACAFFNWHQYQQLAILSLAVLMVSNYLALDDAPWPWGSAVGRVLEAVIGMALAYGVHTGFNMLRNCCNQKNTAQ